MTELTEAEALLKLKDNGFETTVRGYGLHFRFIIAKNIKSERIYKIDAMPPDYVSSYSALSVNNVILFETKGILRR